ncbi:amidophosphoribosyltransferase [Odoribacter sp. OttesenSCG-928-J03]|nr:amidophosphoribosyltransferase [Odoribacter sp. OttesenSCG-928-J03]MDL2330627.1 amidophosphoribosyltransferase [Odoribacter sp. OttesenSCG-928-A06]
MSDAIKHECGIAMVRLLKPAEYYQEKYGTSLYGLNVLYLLMEKQHNRGQEGAGIGCVKLDAQPGEEYIFRERAMGNKAISEVFEKVNKEIADWNKMPEKDANTCPFKGELYLGHLRYSTTGKSGLSYVHPFLRRNNWRSRNLCLAGNFNLTNVDEILADIVEKGQHPRHNADTFIILEQIGYLLDMEVEKLYEKHRANGLSGFEVNKLIEEEIDIEKIIRTASEKWDGGYVICGLTGSGDSFVFRDKWGIRPAFYYQDDEIVVVASERPVIQTILNKRVEEINELKPGESIVIKQDGKVTVSQLTQPGKITPCSFERIYFSRGSDRDIYVERKMLGTLLTDQILKAVDYDVDNTVLSYIPNTAEVAYYGMLKGMEDYLNDKKKKELSTLVDKTPEAMDRILSSRVRTEKLAIKDIKLRTFIAENNSRNDLAAHVYDITYGSIRENVDNIVVIDDSIVRGTTLKKSIIKILSRLNPKKIVIVSSAPQIRYPDCYGIDMSKMEEFIAFNAAIELLEASGRSQLIADVYEKCKQQQGKPKEEIINYVKEIYSSFSDEDISGQVAKMVAPQDSSVDIEIIFQTIDNLHQACKEHGGDWYFSGNYPTPGGNRLVNNSFINFYEKIYNPQLTINLTEG